ncbi:MAG: VirB3 family type IV secretion system protein [Saprospiraceae bacterium]|nr:VirB3 family type IV secretion system protein [Saprospiraceae bacterium]
MSHQEERLDHQEDFREAFLSDELFGDTYHLPLKKSSTFYDDMPSTTPRWLDETRVACLLVGIFGLIYTLFSLDFFYWQIKNPFILNLTLLTTLAGFANFFVYPYALKYCLTNGIRRPKLLMGLNLFMLVFSLLSVVYLFTIPVTGLGLALILIPAPLAFAIFSRRFPERLELYAKTDKHYPFAVIFNQDLRRMAWLTFIVLFTLVIGFFFGLLFNIF